MRVWGIGEVLWDLFPDEERFGGAALNFCANMQRLGEQAVLLSAVAEDRRGRLALERMRGLELSTHRIQVVDAPPTGTAVVTMSEAGEPGFHISRPAAFDRLSVAPGSAAAEPAPDWLYFGTLLQTEPPVEQFTTAVARADAYLRCFYDINLRPGHWNLALVQRLSHLASVLKLNEHEAQTLFHATQPAGTPFSLAAFCRLWAEAHSVEIICVTLGAAGCLVYNRGELLQVPGFAVTVKDTVGSGDAFAAAFLHGYHRGWPLARAARFANALGALVASRAGATPPWSLAECLELAGEPAEPVLPPPAAETAGSPPPPAPAADSSRTGSR